MRIMDMRFWYIENFVKIRGSQSKELYEKGGEIEQRVIIREKKKEGGGPPALRVMAPDTNTWVWEKGPPRERKV